MFKYLRMETGDSVSDATLRQFCEDSRGIIEWLESMGANFESDVPPPKTSYPKDGVYLYYSGNEAVAEYAAVARPAPRGHRTRGSWLSGKAMFEFLRAEVSRVGVHTLTQTAARRLITDARRPIPSDRASIRPAVHKTMAATAFGSSSGPTGAGRPRPPRRMRGVRRGCGTTTT